MKATLLVEVLLREMGLARFSTRLVKAGIVTVADLRRKAGILDALVPPDVAHAIAARAGLNDPADATTFPGAASHPVAASAAASPIRGESGNDTWSPAWVELRQHEAHARETLRVVAGRQAAMLVGGSGARRPRRVEAARAAVDRAHAQLAVARSGLRTVTALRAIDHAKAATRRRFGNTLVSEQARDQSATLQRHLLSVLQTLAVTHDGRRWRDVFADAASSAASSSTVGGRTPDPMRAGSTRPGSSCAPSPSEVDEVMKLRELLSQHGIDHSGIVAGSSAEDTRRPFFAGSRPTSPAGNAPSSKPEESSSIDATLWWVSRDTLHLPIGRNDAADQAKRDSLYRDFDPNGNGYLSLAEIEKGVRDVLRHGDLFQAKPVMRRAYFAARDAAGAAQRRHDGDGDDSEGGTLFAETNDGYRIVTRRRGQQRASFVERSEFRVLLLYLAAFYDLWLCFQNMTVPKDASEAGFCQKRSEADTADAKRRSENDRYLSAAEWATATQQLLAMKDATADPSQQHELTVLDRLLTTAVARRSHEEGRVKYTCEDAERLFRDELDASDGSGNVTYEEFATFAVGLLAKGAPEESQT